MDILSNAKNQAQRAIIEILMRERWQCNTMIVSNKFRATNFSDINRFQRIDREIDKIRAQMKEFIAIMKKAEMEDTDNARAIITGISNDLRKAKKSRKDLMFQQALNKRKRANIDKLIRELG